MIDIEKIKKLAKQELLNIRTYSTLEEWNKLILNLNDLNGRSSETCIYGIIAGNCHNDRAIELIKSCATDVYFSSFFICVTTHPTIFQYDTEPIKHRNFTALEWLLARERKLVIDMISEIEKNSTASHH
jgi:hypothetical protein